jgi:CYTH domain-containing protein
MPVERERTFRVRGPVPRGDTRELRQGYLALDGDVGVRIRADGDDRWLTVKGGRGRSRTEVEVRIGEEEFQELWPFAGERTVSKERTRVRLDDGLVAEVDTFHGRHEGLVLVEVELSSDDEADAFVPPPWFGEDVTDQPWASNAWLAVHGLPDDD